MVKVWILSDLHFETLAPGHGPKLSNVQADLLVVAGDYHRAQRSIKHVREQFPQIPIVLIAGNHEHYRTGSSIPENLKTLRADALADRNENGNETYFLENETVILQLSGSSVRVIGATLWTDFRLFGTPARSMRLADESMNDFVYIKSSDPARFELTPIETVKIHHASRKFIEEQLKTTFDERTIVVTHHLPSVRSVAARYKTDNLSPAFASDCDDLLALGADLWVHGHTHDSCNYMAGNTRVVCNPHGYYAGVGCNIPENRLFDPRLVVEL